MFIGKSSMSRTLWFFRYSVLDDIRVQGTISYNGLRGAIKCSAFNMSVSHVSG